MSTEALADIIINEIKKREMFNISDRASLEGAEMRETIYEFILSYDMARTKAHTLNVPVKTKFRFLKRVINKLIRFHTRQQVEFNYHILGLIKAQHDIIIKNQEMLAEFMFTHKELQEKTEK